MRRIHALTTAGLIFALTGIALIQSGLPWLASAYALMGYFFSLKEISKYTSGFQFFTLFLSAFTLGLSIDVRWWGIPFFTLACIIAAAGSTGRIIFFRKFGYSQYRWFEPFMFSFASLLYLAANLIHPSGWEGWLFPALIIGIQGVLSGGVFNDQKQLYKWRLNLEKQLIKEAKEEKRQLFDFDNHGGRIVKVGTKAPAFSLRDQDGDLVKLSDYSGKKNVLLIFVRGDWCAGCHKMLCNYQEEYKSDKGNDWELLAVCPDSIEINHEMAVKLGLDLKILYDEGQSTAENYGVQLLKYDNIFAEKYTEGIPLPSIFLIDTNGVVQYASKLDESGSLIRRETLLPILAI
ncbi:MAG: peroxiredoxin family protein [Bacteroidota bacterium]